MSGKKTTKRKISPDPLYKNEELSRFINHVMRKGKKSLARKIVYAALEIIKKKTNQDPLEVFQKALENTSPVMEVRARRVGGATYQVPVEVKGTRRLSLAMRWLVGSAKLKKRKSMKEKLAQEIIDAANNTGEAIRKKENLRKLAEANRAFAHLAW